MPMHGCGEQGAVQQTPVLNTDMVVRQHHTDNRDPEINQQHVAVVLRHSQ